MTQNNNTDPPRPFVNQETTFVTTPGGTKRQYSVGDTVDGAYTLTSLLGQGGMGIVFACTHNVLSNNYAIKILSSETMTEESWTRFRSEAQALAKLNHPNIVGIYNMGIDRGQCPYFVMDLLAGEALDNLIARNGRMGVIDTLKIFSQVADALGSAHAQGIIHRDVKPSNIVLQAEGNGSKHHVKIVDFGIARLSKQNLGSQSQTKTGLVFGTPFYMSPEQCQGTKVDQRSDIYSLGCALFETLTGKPPFCGDNSFQTFMLHQTAPPPSLREKAGGESFDDGLEQAVAKMLAKRPSERYQTMGQVKHDLERLLQGKPIKAPGQAITLSPGQSAVEGQDALHSTGTGSFGNMLEQQKQNRTKYLQPEHGRAPLPKWKIGALALSALIICGAAAYGLYLHMAATSKPPVEAALDKINRGEGRGKITEENTSSEITDLLGNNSSDVGIMMDPNFMDFGKNEEKLRKLLRRYDNDHRSIRLRLNRSTDPPVFEFPQDFIITSLSINGGVPKHGTGDIPVAPGDKLCLYLTSYTETWYDLLDNFGPDDLTGLEIATKAPQKTMGKIRDWQRLEHLSFFNTLLKALEVRYEESLLEDSDLPALDKFTRLKTLGLCGQKVTGPAVAKMALLDSIHTLMLKRISDAGPLLQTLAGKDNIREIWLCGMETKDADLEPLTHMKNLETLRIRKSGITPASVVYFKKMPNLKHLYLDREWTTVETKAFIDAVPAYKHEPVLTFTYWQMFPKK